MRQFLLIISSFLLFSASSAQDVKITNLIVGNTDLTGVYMYGETIDVYISYDIQTPGSVLLYATPYTNGVPTDDFAPTGAGLLSGIGSVFRSFSVPSSSSNTRIDEVRIRAISTGGLATYQDFFVPVDFHLDDFHLNLEDLENPKTACFLAGSEHEITLHSIAQGFDVWVVYVRAFSEGEPVSDIFIPLTEGGESYFQIGMSPYSNTESFVLVDEFRVYYGQGLDPLVYPYLSYDVNWLWSPVRVSDVQLPSTSWPINGVFLSTSYDYEIASGVNALIVPRPYTEGGVTPGSINAGTQLVFGSGSDSNIIRVDDNNQKVDGIRYSFTNGDGSGTLGAIVFPTEHFFGDVHIYGLDLQPPSPARIPPSSEYLYYEMDLSKRGNYEIEANVIPDESPFEASPAVLIPSVFFSQPLSGEMKLTEEGAEMKSLRIQCNDAQGEEIADFGYPVSYRFASTYQSACGTDAPALSAPVDLTKSFQPVPFPNGVVDRVQVKWYKESPAVKFQPGDEVGCDIQFWPIRDLLNNIPIIGADSVMLSDINKPAKELFKWPIKFRADGQGNSKRVEPSTRYNWRVRCACGYGTGDESPWSEIKIFNTPAFDPSSGIYTPPPGQYIDEDGMVKRTGEELLELEVFPNPANDHLTVRSSQGIGIDQIEILDMTGRLVQEERGFGDRQYEYRLNVAELPIGIYMARISVKGMQEVIRFEKH